MLRGRFATPEEVVGHHGALQAQEYAGVKWAVARRASEVVEVDVDDALDSGTIVRTHVLRPTWHLVTPRDIRWLLGLTGPRVRKQNEGRLRQLGLDTSTLSKSETIVADALGEEDRLTRSEIARRLEAGGIDPFGQRLAYILMHLELETLICSGSRRGKQHTYALMDERVPAAPARDRDHALIELVRRYLSSHGPATVHDLGWWSSLTLADVTRALDLLGSEVERKAVEGLELWSITGEGPRPASARGAHLLHTYDEMIVGYTRSRFFGDPSAERARVASSGRTMPSGVILVSGRIAGHWRRRKKGPAVDLEIRLYPTEGPDPRPALQDEATWLGRVTGLPVEMTVTSI